MCVSESACMSVCVRERERERVFIFHLCMFTHIKYVFTSVCTYEVSANKLVLVF